MPRSAVPLPDPFAVSPFAVAEAREAGVSAARLRTGRLAAPFVGVRTAQMPATVRDLVVSYLPKMAPAEFFSHRTAALMHDMWLPFVEAERLRLDVAVRPPARAPRDARVDGHHLIDRPGLVEVRDGIPVANPIETWCQLATIISLQSCGVSRTEKVGTATAATARSRGLD